ncbi:MAG: hypothetical protein JXM73_06215 [Anaerolineae bacterium]|nr:hypothetical protein [Anaerolineae bacterium]
MNEQNWRERFHTSDVVDRTEKDTSDLVAYSDPLARVAVEAAPIAETPMGGIVAAVGPMDERIVHEAPMAEAIPYAAPVGEPVADESWMNKPILTMAPVAETITHEAPIGTNAGPSTDLLRREESEHFRTRWNEIQSKFVDEPRSAVQQADALVSEVVEQMTQMFANERSSLESQWNQGDDVSTEDLRKALQRYRSFFNRLVV